MKLLSSKVLCLLVIIFIVGNLYPQNTRIAGLVNQVEQSKIINHVANLCDAGGHKSRVTYTEGNYEAAEYIAKYFENLSGITKVERDTFYVTPAIPPYNEFPVINVIATLEGKSENPNTIIIGGHYDASGSRGSNYEANWETVKAQGADDNATGVGSVMEIAKVLSEPLNQFNNQHTIKFIAFGAEEYHPMHPENSHAGSIWDAFTRKNNNENIEHVIVLDMIGYNNNNNYVEIICNNQSFNLAERVYDFNTLYTPDLKTNESPFEDVPYSDHLSYQDYGYSAILLMENERPWNNDAPNYYLNPFYHTANDTLGTVNFEQVQLVAKLALATVAALTLSEPTSVDQDIMPEDFSLSAFPNPFNPSTTLELGVKTQHAVSLRIYDILGNEITTLVDEQKTAGIHYVTFNADQLSSGVYFAVLSYANNLITHKLLLMK